MVAGLFLVVVGCLALVVLLATAPAGLSVWPAVGVVVLASAGAAGRRGGD